MGIVDAVIQPGYILKSAIKLVLFLAVPILHSCFVNKEMKLRTLFTVRKGGLLTALVTGILVYAVVLGAYFIFRGVFDFSSLTGSLTSTTGVNKNNFIFVAIYISFVNSLVEEFFFRGIGFLKLKEHTSRNFALMFSSLFFALYHIAMMIGWFGAGVIVLSVIGLVVGGIIFCCFNEKFDNLYLSWLIHMCANFATNTIGFILFSA